MRKLLASLCVLFASLMAQAQFVSNVQSTPTASTAVITYSTSSPAKGRVSYGLTASYGSQTTAETALSSTHSASVSGLKSGTTYHYAITQADALNQSVGSVDYSFTTTAISVTVTPSAQTIFQGSAQQFAANVTGSGQGVTWAVAGGGSISSSGLYTAPTSGSSITATVTATSVEDNVQAGSTTITVNPVPIVSVTVSPTTVVLSSAGTQQFTSTVTGSSNTAVTWSTTLGTINSSGLFTAPLVTADSTATVKATSAADPSKSASASVTILAPVSSTNLVAAFSFDENTGTTAHDLSGNANNGTLNGTTWTATGKHGSALSFNGTSSYVDLGRPTSLLTTSSMTWEAWVFATGNPADDGNIVSFTDGSGLGWQVKTSPDTGQHTFGVKVHGATDAQLYSNTVRALNTWYHVAAVYDATARTLKLYVNGVLDNGTLLGTVPASQTLPTTVNVNIGRRSNGYLFKGTIDDVRIFKEARTLTQIQSDMNAAVTDGGSQPPPPPPPLQHVVGLAWHASTSTVVGYNVYRGTFAGGPYSSIKTGVTQLAYTDSTVTNGQDYYYVVTAVDSNGVESIYSNEVHAIVPVN